MPLFGASPFSLAIEEFRGCLKDPDTDRLIACGHLIKRLTDTFTSDPIVKEEECTLAVYTLVYSVLESTDTTQELRNVLLSSKMTSLVSAMLTSCGDAGVILTGVEKAIGKPGVGFHDITAYIFQLLQAWFLADHSRILTKPLFIQSLLSIVYRCIDRQEAVSGHRGLNFDLCERTLLPLVKVAVKTETIESINSRNGRSFTALHTAVGSFYLVSVTRELLKHPWIDVNVTNSSEETPLLYLLSQGQVISERHLDLIHILLRQPSIDLTAEAKSKQNVAQRLCYHLTGAYTDINTRKKLLSLLLLLCEQLSKEKSSKLLIDVFNSIHLKSFAERLDETCAMTRREILDLIVRCTSFPLDIWIKDELPAAHLAAISGDSDLVAKIMRQARFRPDIRDGDGNTTLFLICTSLPPNKAIYFLQIIEWNSKIRNASGQSLVEYYTRNVSVQSQQLGSSLRRFCSTGDYNVCLLFHIKIYNYIYGCISLSIHLKV